MKKATQYDILVVKPDGELETLSENDGDTIALTSVDSEGNVINKL